MPPTENQQTALTNRKSRADGLKSRQTILDAAARLATTRGLDGLSIGELANYIGMSKSGLYAHFKSKEELELATIDTAAEIFENDVIRKVPESSLGLERVRALTEVFIAHLRRRIFPGGCFFATVAAQLAPNPGRARDRVMQMHAAWVEQFLVALRQARDAGEIPRDADLDQLAFEITSMMFRANFSWIATEDTRFLDRARVGVENALARIAQPSKRQPRRRRAQGRRRR
ncbi:MAG TPA: TetR/AcrR family transcriptional regulator [Pirellulales bacterium]|nr:TetR/AcrR family transcriptional regulator [Pirellulales bacterium]